MMKPTLWETLHKLSELGAYSRAIRVSTNMLVPETGLSQQTISRHLIELERLGLIERQISVRGEQIKLTEKGAQEIRRVYLSLKSIVEKPAEEILIEGELFTGMFEGSYYVNRDGYRNQFIKKLGFNPYPGTLNLKLSSPLDQRARKELEAHQSILIDGFRDGGRTFGPVRCYPATINDEVEGAVVLIDRTHYNSSVLEVIAPMFLRKRLKIRDGSKVRVRVRVEQK